MQFIAYSVLFVLFAADQLISQYLTASGLSACEWLLPVLWRVVAHYVGVFVFGMALHHTHTACSVVLSAHH